MSSVSTTAVQRLRKDAARLAKDPVPYICAVPLSSNILEWHYVVQGPSDSLYAGGIYHGKLVFPSEYPFKPPSIYILTPNGRFQTNTRLCLSISDFHPDTWNPAWSVGTILTGLLSFMLETSPTMGSVETTDSEKRRLAEASIAHNLKNKTFRSLFPDLCKQMEQDIEEEKERQRKKEAADEARLAAVVSSSTSSDHINKNSQGVQNQTRNRNAHQHQQQPIGLGIGFGGSAVSNFLMFVGVVAFVFAARYVLQTAE